MNNTWKIFGRQNKSNTYIEIINMIRSKITIVFILILGITLGVYAQQQTCYQIGLNEGREIYNEAQRLERAGRLIDAVPLYWEALQRFRLTRNCRDLPSNHELETWENRCITGMTNCGGKYNETSFLMGSPQLLRFAETGGEQAVAVNTNANTWRFETNQSWYSIRRINNRLVVTCMENTEPNSRSGRLIIVANSLTYEVTIEQAGKTPVEQSASESIMITEAQFAGGYADGVLGDYGETLFDNMIFLRSQIIYHDLASENKTIKLDFKIIDPNEELLSDFGSDYTYSEEITLQGNLQQNNVFALSAWGATNEEKFSIAGKYVLEIWCSGVYMFSTSFEVLPKPVPPPYESIEIMSVQFASQYADGIITDYGDEILNHLTFILPRITFTNLTEDSKTLQFDFSISDPEGNRITPTTGDSWQMELNVYGNAQQVYVFDAPEWGADHGTAFEKTGIYQFEIWSAGVSIFTSPFEVLAPQPVLPVSQMKLKTSVGVKAGLNMSTINNRMTSIQFSPTMKYGFHAGVFVDLSLDHKGKIWRFFSLQPEVNYSRQGFEAKGTVVDFDYLVGLLMLKLHVLKDLYIEFGPHASYLLSVSPTSVVFSEKNIQLSNLEGGKDVGTVIGIGYDFNFGLIAGARYQSGVSDVAHNLFWTNKVITISLGWRF